MKNINIFNVLAVAALLLAACGGVPFDGDGPDAFSGDAGASGADADPLEPDATPGGADADMSCSTNLSIDDDNCGSCGHVCLTGNCNNGMCQALAVTEVVDEVGGFATNGVLLYYLATKANVSSIYMAGATEQTVNQAPVCPNSPCVTSVDSIYPQMLNDGTYVYYASYGGIYRVQIGASPFEPNQFLSSSSGATGGIAIVGNEIYWSTANGVRKAPKTGGSPFIVDLQTTASKWLIHSSGRLYGNTGTHVWGMDVTGLNKSTLYSGVQNDMIGESNTHLFSVTQDGQLQRTDKSNIQAMVSIPGEFNGKYVWDGATGYVGNGRVIEARGGDGSYIRDVAALPPASGGGGAGCSIQWQVKNIEVSGDYLYFVGRRENNCSGAAIERIYRTTRLR